MKAHVAFLALVTVLVLLLASSGATALADTVLTMPAALRIIEEEAFCGANAIDKVVLSDNVTEIQARAFANSTLSEINLPDSLTFIDESAFDGPEKVTVTANPGTYAYNWAVENHYIILAASITLDHDALTLAPEETAALTAEVLPENATDKTVAWTTSDASVATVEDGVVTAVSVGTATITATAGSLTAECAVTVEEPAPTYAAPVNLTLNATGTVTFTVAETNPHTVMLGVYKEAVQPRSFSLLATAYADGAELIAVLPIPINSETSYSTNISYFFDETAGYYVAAKAVGSADEENARNLSVGNAIASNKIYFTRPETALDTPTAAWSDAVYGRAVWSSVEGAASYQVMLFSGNTILFSRNVTGNRFDFSTGWIDFEHTEEKQYTFAVTAMSGNIARVSNSAQSARSAVLGEPPSTAPVEIITHPASKYAPMGKALTASVHATGIGLTYDWHLRNNTTGEVVYEAWDDATVPVDSSVASTVDVWVVIHDAFGNSVTSEVGVITIVDETWKNTVIATQPQSVTDQFADGSNVYFYVYPVQMEQYYRISYQWYRSTDDGSTWNEWSTGYGTSIRAYARNDGYQFKVKVTVYSPTGKKVGEELSRAATLSLLVPPICIEENLDTVYYTAATQWVSIQASGKGLRYQWFVNYGSGWNACFNANTNTFRIGDLTRDAQIYCEVANDVTVESSNVASVYIGGNPATGISVGLNSGPEHAAVGDTIYLRCDLTPYKATSPVSWTSSDTGVATVSGGRVTATGFGTAAITAEANGLTDDYVVSVDSYRVTYDPDGGVFDDGTTRYRVERVIRGQTASLPSISKEGDVFLGWSANGTDVLNAYTPTGNITLRAKWEKSGAMEDKALAIEQDLAANQYQQIGKSALFEVVTNGAKVSEYTWYVDDGTGWTPINDGVTAEASRTSLEVLATADNNGFRYKVEITSARYGNTVTSTVATLTTGETDTPPQPADTILFVTQPFSVTAYEGEPADFSAAVANDNAAYQWQVKTNNGVWTDISGATGTMLDLDYVIGEMNGNKYRCVATVGQISKASAEAELTVIVQYTVTYNANGGYFAADENNAQTLVVEGIRGEYDIDVESPIYESHTFLGWATSDDASADDVITSITVSENMTLYAVWEENTIIYTITYHGNGGLFDGEDETLTEQTPHGQNYSVEVNRLPERTGYTFVAWGDVNGVEIEDDNFVPTSNMDFYAIWEVDQPQPTTYTITYDANGGAFPDESTVITATFTVDYFQSNDYYAGQLENNGWLNEPVWAGHYFMGWSESKTYTEGDLVYDSGSEPSGIPVNGDVCLYACWVEEEPEPVSYTVTYHANGGSFGEEVYSWDDTGISGSYTLSDVKPVWADHHFLGWCYSDEGGEYAPETMEVTENIDLYADWGVNVPQTITFMAYGGNFLTKWGLEDYVCVEVTEWPYIIDIEPPQWHLHSFLGWSLRSDGQGERVTELEYKEHPSLYAVWGPEDTTLLCVFYDTDGGTMSKYWEEQHAGTYTIRDEVPVKDGYTFLGWTLDGVFVQGEIELTEDINLVAQWRDNSEPVSYTVTYWANGGAFPNGEESMWGTFTEEYLQENGYYVGDLGDNGWVETPEREGYEFWGWLETPEWTEDGCVYDDGSLNSDHCPSGMAITGDVDLYAYWVAEEPQRTLSVTMDDVTQSVGMGATFFAVPSWSDGTEVTGAVYRWYVQNDGGWTEIPGTYSLTRYDFAPTIGMNGNRYKVVVTCDGQEASAEATLTVGYRVRYDAYFGEFPNDVGRYINIIVTEAQGGCYVGDWENGNSVPDPTREGFTFAGWYDAYFQIEYEVGSWLPVNDDTILYAYWPEPEPEPEELTVNIWADTERLTVNDMNPECSDNLYIWSDVQGATGDLTYQWQQKTIWDDDFVDTWSMGYDESSFYMEGFSVEDGTTYRLVVNGVASNEITIYVYHESPQDMCPECGGMNGEHFEWCSMMGGGYPGGEEPEPGDPEYP